MTAPERLGNNGLGRKASYPNGAGCSENKRLPITIPGVNGIVRSSVEGVTGFASPGARMMSLLPPRGLRDFGRSLVLSITLDSAFCFAVLVGVYMLFSKLFMAKRIS
jgi:hypothetical protein